MISNHFYIELFDNKIDRAVISEKKVDVVHNHKSKRGRFNTWDLSENLQFSAAKDKLINESERSVALNPHDDDYFNNFKNYSLSMYDKANQKEDSDPNKNNLKLNLNPCLPLDFDNRKVSFNSLNPETLGGISYRTNISSVSNLEDDHKNENDDAHSNFLPRNRNFEDNEDYAPKASHFRRKRLNTVNMNSDLGNINNAKKRAGYRRTKAKLSTMSYQDNSHFAKSIEKNASGNPTSYT